MSEKIKKNKNEESTLQKTLDTKHKKEVTVEITNPGIKKKGDELVTGVFRNLEVPDKDIKFSYSDSTYPAKFYTLHHGKEETIPRKVADHINSCSYTTPKAIFNNQGEQVGVENVTVQRYFFSSVNY